MCGHFSPEITCTMCDKPVDLTVDLVADEHGKSVHEGCYTKRLIGNRDEFPVSEMDS
jgi:hypothetical protein